MTLTKFAKLAHVSVSTASKAFSMSDDISGQTREEIFRIAREKGCFKKFFNAPCPNLVIGVLIPEFSSFVYADYVEKLEKALRESGCTVCVSATDFSEEKERELVEYFYKYSAVDGLILVSPKIDPGEIELPTVLISREKPLSGCAVNSSGEEEQVRKAMEYLREKNVFSVGFLGETKTVTHKRLFESAMQAVFGHIDPELIEITGLRFEKGGYAAMESFFEKETVPRAVFCAYDDMAIGAIRCIRDHALRVPEDVAVIGFDNIAQGAFMEPPLASISQNNESICRHAAEQLLHRILGEPFAGETLVPAVLHLRKSFEI